MKQMNGCCAVNVFYSCYIGSERSAILAVVVAAATAVVVVIILVVPTAAASDAAIVLFFGIYPEGECCYSVSPEKDRNHASDG